MSGEKSFGSRGNKTNKMLLGTSGKGGGGGSGPRNLPSSHALGAKSLCETRWRARRPAPPDSSPPSGSSSAAGFLRVPARTCEPASLRRARILAARVPAPSASRVFACFSLSPSLPVFPSLLLSLNPPNTPPAPLICSQTLPQPRARTHARARCASLDLLMVSSSHVCQISAPRRASFSSWTFSRLFFAATSLGALALF